METEKVNSLKYKAFLETWKEATKELPGSSSLREVNFYALALYPSRIEKIYLYYDDADRNKILPLPMCFSMNDALTELFSRDIRALVKKLLITNHEEEINKITNSENQIHFSLAGYNCDTSKEELKNLISELRQTPGSKIYRPDLDHYEYLLLDVTDRESFFENPLTRAYIDKSIDGFNKITTFLDFFANNSVHLTPLLTRRIFNSLQFNETGFIDSSEDDMRSTSEKDFINYISNIKKKRSYISLAKASLLAIILGTVEALAYFDLPLKKCQLCGKYFVPKKRTDEKYCDFENPKYPGKTCKEAIRLIKIKEREKEDKCSYLAKRIYNRLYARKKDKSYASRKIVEDFVWEKEIWKKDIASGKKNKEDFYKWLREQDELYSCKRKRKEKNNGK